MAKKDESQLGFHRRDFLKGITATGGALIGGGAVRHFGPSESVFNSGVYHFANDIYTGSASVINDFPSSFTFEFFQDVKTDEFQLMVSAYEYPSGNLIDRSEINMAVGASWGQSIDIRISDFNGFVDYVDVNGELVNEDDNGVSEWRSNGRMYNLVDGSGLPLETAANVHTTILPRLETSEVKDTPVIFAFQLVNGDKITLVRQTPPIDVESGIIDDPVTVPTEAEQFPSMSSGITGKFTRSEKEGQYVMSYNWGYDEKEYNLVLPIHKMTYGVLHDTQPRFVTSVYEEAQKSPYGRQLGEAMFEIALSEGYGEEYAFELVRTFAQTWPYEEDQNLYGQIQYPNFAEEALVEGVGDCVDKTMIMTSMYSQPPFDYNVALVFPPQHLAPAIDIKDIPVEVTDEMTTVEMGGTEYVYIESTSVKSAGDPYFDVEASKAMYDGRWRNINHTGISETVIDYFQRVLGHK